jgi:uncharacterized protein (TIGR02145 family)
MKRFPVIFLLIFATVTSWAQSYQINFSGIGAATTVDSIKIENLALCIDTTIGGNDIVNLSGIVRINEFNTFTNNSIKISPNPMPGNCLIDFEATEQGETMIQLYSITGKKIFQTQEFLTKGHHTYNLSGICSGIYLIKIKSKNYFYVAKLISNNAEIGFVELRHIESTMGAEKQSSISNENSRNLKGSKSVIDMIYNTGDRLKFTGFSGGKYRTITTLVPDSNQTVTFNFVYCADADSNYYSVVQIGTFLFMGENLKATKYRNGDLIPNITDGTAWSTLNTGAYCCYDNLSSNCAIYGNLYNWFVVADPRNICPVGWHIANNSEWNTFLNELGGSNIAGSKLKETCSNHWISPNLGANNETGLTVLPTGFRLRSAGVFKFIGKYTFFWGSTEGSATIGSEAGFYYDQVVVGLGYDDKRFGHTIRCIKD